MDNDKPSTAEEVELLNEALKSYGAPTAEEKHSVHTFLHKVSIAPDTTKTGNLGDDELGWTRFSLRTYKELELISEDIIGNKWFKDYFHKKGEILTSTSLSKEGFLDKLAITQTRQIADITKSKKVNAGWFKKGEEKKDENQI